MQRAGRPDVEAAWRLALAEKFATLDTQEQPRYTVQRRPHIRYQESAAVLRDVVTGGRPTFRTSIHSGSDVEDDPLGSSEAHPSNLRRWARDISSSFPQPPVLSDQHDSIATERVVDEKMPPPDEHGALPIGSRTSTATKASAATSGSSSSDRTVRASWSTMAKSTTDTALTPPISVHRASIESAVTAPITKPESPTPSSPSLAPPITGLNGGGFLSALALHLSIMPAMTRIPWSRSSNASRTEINELPMSASMERKSMPTVWEFEEQDVSGHWQASPAIGRYEADCDAAASHRGLREDQIPVQFEADDDSGDEDSRGHTTGTSDSGLTEIVLGDIMEVVEANRSASRPSTNEQLGALSGAWKANAMMLGKDTV